MVVTTITKKHTLVNFSNQKITPKYIVWHDTGVRDQSDEGNANYFYSVYREASANYFIDENSITEVVAPGYVAWHVGDGEGKYGITNYNSIGIELCVEADGNFKPETIANAVWLGKKLMADWRISYEGNVRHYDASRKNCPQFLNTDGKWSKWYSFKAQLALAANPEPIVYVPVRNPITYDATIVAKGFSIDSKPWGESGSEYWGKTDDLVGRKFYFFEENYSKEYVNGMGLGWVDKRAIKQDKKVVASILHLPNGKTWTVYPENGPYQAGHVISLEGNNGESTFTILGSKNNDKCVVVNIPNFGQVSIYFDADKGATVEKIYG